MISRVEHHRELAAGLDSRDVQTPDQRLRFRLERFDSFGAHLEAKADDRVAVD